MRTILITTALADVKSTLSLIAKKREALISYLTRNSRLTDPIQGGSEEHIKKELQSIDAMEKNIVNVRVAILRKNLESPVQVGDETKTVTEWLSWRKEIATPRESFIHTTLARIRLSRGAFEKEIMVPVSVPAGQTEIAKPTLIVNIKEKALMEEEQNITEKLAKLDSVLSIFNATTSIEVVD